MEEKICNESKLELIKNFYKQIQLDFEKAFNEQIDKPIYLIKIKAFDGAEVELTGQITGHDQVYSLNSLVLNDIKTLGFHVGRGDKIKYIDLLNYTRISNKKDAIRDEREDKNYVSFHTEEKKEFRNSTDKVCIQKLPFIEVEHKEAIDKAIETVTSLDNLNVGEEDHSDDKFFDTVKRFEELEKKALKFDEDKLLYNLIEPDFLKQIARVLTSGAKKYTIDNWKRLDDAKNRYMNACMRHLEAYRAGEEFDPDSGITHLAHIASNLMFLRWFDEQERNKKGEVK